MARRPVIQALVLSFLLGKFTLKFHVRGTFTHNHTKIAQSSKLHRGQIPRDTIKCSYKGSMQRWNTLGDSNSGTTNFFFLRFSKTNVIWSIFKGREKNLGKVSSFEMKRMEMSQKDEPLL